MSAWVWQHSLFLYLIPVAILVFIAINFLTPSLTLGFSRVLILKKIAKSPRVLISFFPSLFLLTALICILIALARPQNPLGSQNSPHEGVDIMLVIDISDSMLIEDMPPHINRLEASKTTITKFIEKRTQDRIGLIVFSGDSYTRVPLTLDHEWLVNDLKEVSAHLSVEEGTAIGVAVVNGVTRLERSSNRSRILIFLTDGESNRGVISPETALNMAKKANIKVYSIGLGKDGEAKIPVKRKIGGIVHKTYYPIHSKINVKLLQKMASETQGKYYRVNDNFSIESVFKDIDKLETSSIKIKGQMIYEEKAFQFINWALIALLFALLFRYIFVRVYP